MLRKYSVVKNWAVGLGAFFALCSVMLAGLINPAGAAGVVVTNVRVGTSDTQTRIVFDMTSAVNAKVFTLADPYRLVIDLPEVGWRLPSRPLPSNIGNVEKLRYGLFQVGNSRVVIDMKAPALVVSAFILKPLDT